MTTHLDWDRLGRIVRAARGPRAQADIAASGGPSDETISKIEQGRWRPTRSVQKTLEKLEVGLGWAPGSANAVLTGGDPIPLGDETADHLRQGGHPLGPAQTPEADPSQHSEGPSTTEASAGAAATHRWDHPLLAEGASIEAVASRLESLLNTMDALRANHQRMQELANTASAIAGPAAPDMSDISRSLDEAHTADTEFSEFVADLLFQIMTTASASNAAEVRALIRPLYDRVVKGTPMLRATDGKEVTRDMLDLAARRVEAHDKPE